MTYSVYQHWDPLKTCIVGRTYPPEFYSWMKNSRLRKIFENIAIETEEDYQSIIKFLENFGVRVLRPDLPEESFVQGKFLPPPMNPRDHTGMIGSVFYYNQSHLVSKNLREIYDDIKDTSWPPCQDFQEFKSLPDRIQKECIVDFKIMRLLKPDISINYGKGCYDRILEHIKSQGNTLKKNVFKNIKNNVINRASMIPLGRDLFVGTTFTGQDQKKLSNILDIEFEHTHNHIIDSGGHLDGCLVPVAPGLVFSALDFDIQKFFPGWQIVKFSRPSISDYRGFDQLKKKNRGKWWMPCHENDQELINFIDEYLINWTGYVEETVFDVNLLIIDPKNILVANHYDRQTETILHNHGIQIHVLPLRHRFFWDGGIHCMTSDIDREGEMKDYWPMPARNTK